MNTTAILIVVIGIIIATLCVIGTAYHTGRNETRQVCAMLAGSEVLMPDMTSWGWSRWTLELPQELKPLVMAVLAVAIAIYLVRCYSR